MKVINITVKDKIATGNGTKIVCNNSDYQVKFTFDEQWQQHKVKTMRVRYGGKYEEVVFEGDTAQLPQVQNTLGVEIGVYASDLETTTPAYFDALKSILCGSEVHADPPEDVYNQLIKLIENGGGTVAPGEDGKSAYEIAVANGFSGSEQEWLESLHGEDGADGYTPVKNVDYFDGKDGKDGIDGKDGQDGYTPIKGVDYFDGKDGADGTDGSDGVDGEDGYTPVKGVDYFDGADGTNGKDGADGTDGYTPVKGTDYWTDEDKAAIVQDVLAQLPSEEWTFTLEDGSTVTKKVYLNA